MKEINNIKIIDKYDLMEEKLKDDARSLKFIKSLGRELINKIKMIDEEINSINPERKQFNTLPEKDREKLIALYPLKDRYNAQFDMIMVILNKSDDVISDTQVKKYKERGLEDNFFINITSE